MHRRAAAQARRRRRGLTALALLLLLATLVLGQPNFAGYSAYEDPRPGGIAVRIDFGSLLRQRALIDYQIAHGPDEGELWTRLPGDGSEAADDGDGQEQGLDVRSSDKAVAVAEGGPVWYIVQPGDNLSTIGDRYDVSVSDLWIANRLLNPHSLQPGQSLLIPSGPDDVFGFDDPTAGPVETDSLRQPAYHTVRAGDNLWTIARRYGVTATTIRATNGLSMTGLIHPGDQLEIPGAERDDTSGAATRLRLAWPVYGAISSPFGMRNGKMHEGLDIAADSGTPIRAAASGRVTSAGWMGNYGNALLIDHGNGLTTLYAHCDKLLVARGERVEAGQLIARVGSTGRSTGPHLHFEVMLYAKRIDPLRYLLGA